MRDTRLHFLDLAVTVIDRGAEARSRRAPARAMEKGARAEASLRVNASPDELYGMVSDVTRMREWSPETVQCQWVGGATGPTAGARFKGTNRRGIMRWSTKPEVVVAERGKEFAFVTKGLGRSTKWTYCFVPARGGGTDVIESFEMLDDMPKILFLLDRYLMHISDRQADLQAGMRCTLERIRTAAEGND
jgi:hypothetical protein